MLSFYSVRKYHWIVVSVMSLLALNSTKYVSAATDYNQYLFQIFYKYGNGTMITFEGLEHLMYSLGLGYLEFEPTHTIATHRTSITKVNNSNIAQSLVSTRKNNTIRTGTEYQDDNIITLLTKKNGMDKNKIAIVQSKVTPDDAEVDMTLQKFWPKSLFQEFKEMHDPKHRHPRDKGNNYGNFAFGMDNGCLTPKSLLRLIFNDEDLHKQQNRVYNKPMPAIFDNKLSNVNSGQSSLNRDQNMDAINKNNISANVSSSVTHHNIEEEYNEFVNTVQLTPLSFLKLCPALLMQIDQQVCVRAAPSSMNTDNRNNRIWQAWFYASASIFILSASGLIGILIIPLMKAVAYQQILDFLISIAIGTLSGDALMHLLPHALHTNYELNDINSTKNSANRAFEIHEQIIARERRIIWIYACTFFSALFMYLLEHMGPLFKSSFNNHNEHQQQPSHHQHFHMHSYQTSDRYEQQRKTSNSVQKEIRDNNNKENTQNMLINPEIKSTTDKLSTSTIIAPVTNVALEKSLPVAVANVCELNEPRELNIMMHENELDNKKAKLSNITPVAFMVIIGDGLHNLTDGLAIGAAFGNDSVTGIATAFAVLCHELPHELGDFALLLQTGISIQRVIFLNISSSILSFIGMAIGLLVTGIQSDMSQWIYAVTAGSFLYIAFADLMPSLSNNGNRELPMTKIDNIARFWTVFLKVFGILIGGCIMMLIALNEHDIQKLFK